MHERPVVLVVDDQAGNRETLRALLSADPWDVCLCDDGAAALRQAARRSPDLVLLDVMMPGLDGYEVCRRLRADPSLAEVPVIMVTSLDDREARRAGFEAGADDFVTKPYDRLELRTRVRGLLRLNRFRRLLEERALVEKQKAALVQVEKLAAMGSLLAGVAHELNNPLAVVTGHAALLLCRPLDEKDLNRARQILAAGERCARIVRNFLALARQQPPERQRVDLNAVVRDALELLAHSLRLSGVEVRADLEPDLPPLWADGHRLHQVVVNLVSNAEHALRQVNGERRLRVSTRSLDRVAMLEVSDSGPGVPPELRERIFEPFFTTKPPGEGTGLGLALCAGVALEHDGSLELGGAPGKGATFTLRLPLGTPGESAAPQAPLSTAPRRVLVVDDDPSLADVLADALRLEGHAVEAALSGRQALQLLEQTLPDLVVSDVRMPDMDGPALHAEATRRWPALAQRFLFMTGDTVSGDTRRALERIGLPVLEKPFALEDAQQAVARALQALENQGAGS